MTKKQTVTSGEERLIERHFRPLAKHPGAFNLVDDAAALAPPAGCDLVLTTDAIVAGIHFFPRRRRSVAKKALRVNLSDLAAKGAKPLGFLLTLALPEIGESWLELFARGLGDDADTTSARCSAAIPCARPARLRSRSRRSDRCRTDTWSVAAARLGDAAMVTGTIGDAALGLCATRSPPPNVGSSTATQYHLMTAICCRSRAMRWPS